MRSSTRKLVRVCYTLLRSRSNVMLRSGLRAYLPLNGSKVKTKQPTEGDTLPTLD
jgi:hypothetical protein